MWVEDLGSALEVLKTEAPEGFRWIYRKMIGEDHGTSVYRSTFDGLRWIHADWDMDDLLRQGNLANITARFESLSRRLGFDVAPPEDLLNLVGYRLLGEGRGEEALAVFSAGVELYPDSANVYDSLGEALENEGKLPGAMRNYRRAVVTAEANGDRRLPIFRANLARVESSLLQRGSAGNRVFEENPLQPQADGSPRR
jgi:tetratricopeptide (TPR) repeat protein